MSRRSIGLSSARFVAGFGRDRDNLGGGGGGADDDIDIGGSDKTDDDSDDDADDDDSDDDDTDDDDSDDDADDKGKGKKTSVTHADGRPVTQKDFEELTRSLRQARRDARKGKGGTDDKGKGGKDDAPDADAIRAEVESEVTGQWKGRVVRTAARAALSEAGLIGKPERLIRLLDMDEIDVDPEDDEIDGLDDQIRDLKKEYPHLFRKKGTTRLDGADKDRSRNTGKMSVTEIQAAQLRGEL